MRRYVVMAAGPIQARPREYVESWLRLQDSDPQTNFRVFSDDVGSVFVRAEFACRLPLEVVRADFEVASADWSLEAWHLQALDSPRILVLASRTDHCLHELLALQQQGRLAGEIVQVVSNHPDLRSLVEVYGVPFLAIEWPSQQAKSATGAAAPIQLARLIKASGAGLVVMARFMRVIPPELCAIEPVINVHHACTVAFPGGNTHRRMRERGVKVLTATAHYATAGLDEGPIITQEVRPVESLGPAPSTSALQAASRPIEASALVTAVNWHCKGELLVWRGRTVHLAP